MPAKPTIGQSQTQRTAAKQTQQGEQKQTQVTRQTLIPIQQATTRLLRMTQLEFEQDIMDHLASNPALEESGNDYDTDDLDNLHDNDGEENYGGDNDSYDDTDNWETGISTPYDYDPDDVPRYYDTDNQREFAVADTDSFYNEILMQAASFNLNERQQQILEYLINSLDSDGFLRKKATTLSFELQTKHDIDASRAEVEEMIGVLRKLEPHGLGAENLQDCLILQLQAMDKDNPLRNMAIDILTRSFDHYKNKHYDYLMRRHKIERPTLDSIYSLVKHLNPRPADAISSGSTSAANPVNPDFEVHESGDSFVITLCHGNAPRIKLSDSYVQTMASIPQLANTSAHGAAANRELETIRRQANDANLYIEAVRQRQQTMLATMQAIVHLQPEFFRSGDKALLRPMIEKDVADIIKRDTSTVSGVVSNKYAYTDYGMVQLGSLFNSTFVNQQGEEVSRNAVQDKLRQLIENEDKAHPLQDDKLAELLGISRRTVTKYRLKMNIPKASQRK